MKDYRSYDRVEDFQTYSARKLFECQLAVAGSDVRINDKNTRAVISNEFNPYSETKEDRKISVWKEELLKRGDYVFYDEENYIVMSDIDKKPLVYKDGKISKCQHTINLPIFKNPLPCIMTNSSYGVKTKYDNDYLSDSDSKIKIYIQDNSYTEQIDRDFRVIFESSKHMVFKVIDINYFYKGLCELICKKDKYMEGLDDLKNNLAYNIKLDDNKPPLDYRIVGLDEIKLNVNFEFSINPLDNNVLWSVDDETIAKIVNNNGSKCTVKGILKDEMFVLYAKDMNGRILNHKAIFVVK